jgi:hypothetical protein
MVRAVAPLLFFLFLTSFSSLAAAAEELPSCAQMSDPGKNCSCDLRRLRPLQGAIGEFEVAQKAKQIKDDPSKAEDRLAKDPIKVVRGPNRDLFIIDHHHSALAWLDAGFPGGICSIEHPELSADSARFWDQLADKKLDHLEDRNGVAIPHEKLPRTLPELRSEDDPYRSLAGLVRKNGGFCRDSMHPEFAEFRWADFMRSRPELPVKAVAASPRDMLGEALKIARGPAARDADLPGYNGCDGEAHCPKCPDGEEQ